MTHYQRLVLSGLLIIMKMMLVLFKEFVIVNKAEADECLTWIETFSAQINDAYETETEKEDTSH